VPPPSLSQWCVAPLLHMRFTPHPQLHCPLSLLRTTQIRFILPRTDAPGLVQCSRANRGPFRDPHHQRRCRWRASGLRRPSSSLDLPSNLFSPPESMMLRLNHRQPVLQMEELADVAGGGGAPRLWCSRQGILRLRSQAAGTRSFIID
jgi:hypothetical protein